MEIIREEAVVMVLMVIFGFPVAVVPLELVILLRVHREEPVDLLLVVGVVAPVVSLEGRQVLLG